jgi:cation transport ATPase
MLTGDNEPTREIDARRRSMIHAELLPDEKLALESLVGVLVRRHGLGR